MYSKSKRVFTNKMDLANYIEDSDVYNSELLNIISQSEIEREEYKIRKFEFRPDLISRDYYGDSRYFGLFLLTCGADFDDFQIGNSLYLIPKDTLDKLIAII